MRFSSQNLLAGAATLFSLVSFSQAADCINGPFGTVTTVGNPDHGEVYCASRWDSGAVAIGLEVWGGSLNIFGIQISFSDGTRQMIGTPTRDDDDKYYGTLNWGVGDTITKATIWRNKQKNAVVKIELEISTGGKLEVGREWGDSSTILTSSGILLGIRGGVGKRLDNLGLLFLSSTVGKAEITGLTFTENLDDWNKKQTGVDRAFNVAEVYVVNPNQNINSTYVFRNTKTLTNSLDIGSSIKNAFGMSIAVEAGGKVGIPFFAEGEMKVTTTASYSYEDVRTVNKAVVDGYAATWEQAATIGPGRAVHCKATAQSGTFDSDYMSTVTVTLADQHKFEIKQPGTFKSAGWASCTSTCKDIAAKDAPDGSVVAQRGMKQFFA